MQNEGKCYLIESQKIFLFAKQIAACEEYFVALHFNCYWTVQSDKTHVFIIVNQYLYVEMILLWAGVGIYTVEHNRRSLIISSVS